MYSIRKDNSALVNIIIIIYLFKVRYPKEFIRLKQHVHKYKNNSII